MKPILLIIALLAAVQFSCSRIENQVVITGQFSGDIPDSFRHTLPVNSTSYEGFYGSVTPDTSGNFKVMIDTDRPALINFLYLGSPSLIIEPGNHYEITLALKPDGSLELGGDLSRAQEVYSALPHQHPMSCLYSYGEEFTNYHSIKQNLTDDMQKEISLLNDLYDQGLITEQVLDLLVTDRRIYYHTAMSVLASRNNLHYMSEDGKVPDEVFELWKEAAYGVPRSGDFFLSSFYSWYYLQMCFFYNTYTTFDFDDFNQLRARRRAGGTIHSHNIELAGEYMEGDVLEFFVAGSFYYQHMRREYDKDMVMLFEQFKGDFPQSRYIPFVETTLEEMVERQNEMN